MTPTPAERAALKAARAVMRYPSDPAEADALDWADAIDLNLGPAINRKLADMRATGCHN